MNAAMPGPVPAWVLVGSAGLWAADCLTAGCGWTATTPTSDTAATAATRHTNQHHHSAPHRAVPVLTGASA